jgi:hypothetical protein
VFRRTYLSPGLIPICLSTSFPVPFSKIKWLRFVEVPEAAPSKEISVRLGSDNRGYGRVCWKIKSILMIRQNSTRSPYLGLPRRLDLSAISAQAVHGVVETCKVLVRVTEPARLSCASRYKQIKLRRRKMVQESLTCVGLGNKEQNNALLFSERTDFDIIATIICQCDAG